MKLPLHNYFISSGHNSYLTGNQLIQDCGVSTIELSLKSGCRMLELDIWNPRSKKGHPLVLHGYTATKAVSLKKCLNVIKLYAFFLSDFPLIITFENHCDEIRMKMLAAQLNDTFGSMLFIPEVRPEITLSPAQLSGKILIRLKTNYFTAEKNDVSDTDDDHDAINGDDEISPVPTELLRLVYLEANSKSSFWKKESHLRFVTSCSLSEKQLIQLTKFQRTAISFTQRHFIRVYPNAIRVDSSNFDPMTAWLSGSQMVALNFQNNIQGVISLNRGLFRKNGMCGYVLKPDWMRTPGSYVDISTLLPNKVLKVTVLSSCSSKRTSDMYVKLILNGIPRDVKVGETSYVLNYAIANFNQSFYFPISEPEMALLSIYLVCIVIYVYTYRQYNLHCLFFTDGL